MKRVTLKPFAAGLLIGGMLMGIVGNQASALPADPAPIQPDSSAWVGPGSFSGLVKQVQPAVVNISIVGSNPKQIFI